MSPISPASLPKQPAGAALSTNPEPFVLTIGKDGQVTCGSGKATGAEPNDAIKAADSSAPVPATELVAALDRAARTAVGPAAADADGSKDAKDPEDSATDAASPPAPSALLTQASVPANPFAALLAAAPVVAQAIVADEPKTAGDGVQAPKLPDAKTASGTVAAADVTLAKPADPAMAALFAMAKDMARNTESPSTTSSVEVSVTMLSDIASDADTTPTFSLPSATAAMHQLASASSAQPVMAADTMINRHLDLARGDAWLDTLTQDIAAAAGTGERLRFALQPEHLGKLDVEVARHGTGVAVHMTTRNEEARAIIAAAQPRLIDELRANGTRVVEAGVTSQMDAQTNSQSGNASRRPMTSFIEAAVDLRTAAATRTTTISASGRYA